MIPGKVFERKYNAGAVAGNNAGTLIMSHEFEPKHLRATAKKLILSKEARKIYLQRLLNRSMRKDTTRKCERKV